MSDRLRLRDDALEWRELEGEIVAVDMRESVYMTVNQSGAILWPALLEGATKEELVERLMTAFALDRAAAAHDVDAFVEMLERQDLIAH
jgi:hypothetical protein